MEASLRILQPGFRLIYGLTADIFFRVFGVKREGRVRTGRSIIALTLSTAITGILAMSVTVMIGLMPMVFIPYLIIILVRILNGAAAGYLTPSSGIKLPTHSRKLAKGPRSS